jgi:hypothetical protein
MNLNNTAIKILIVQFVVSLMYVFLQDKINFHRRQTERIMFMHQMQSMTNAYYVRRKLKNRYRVKKKRMKKRWWIKFRSSDWWDRIVAEHFTQEDWLSNVRMSADTFKYLCNRLKPHLCAQDNWVRQLLTVEKKVAIALYKLASCAEYRIVANQFGTNKCVVHKCIPGHFFNIEHSPYLFPMFSFKKHRSMHVCNHVTKVTKIST